MRFVFPREYYNRSKDASISSIIKWYCIKKKTKLHRADNMLWFFQFFIVCKYCNKIFDRTHGIKNWAYILLYYLFFPKDARTGQRVYIYIIIYILARYIPRYVIILRAEFRCIYIIYVYIVSGTTFLYT